MTSTHPSQSQPVYFFPSDSDSSPSASSSGDATRRESSGSDKDSTTAAATTAPAMATATAATRSRTTTTMSNSNAPLALVSPITPLTPGGGAGGSYFDPSHSRQHRHHHHHHAQAHVHPHAPAHTPTHAHPRSFAHLLLGSAAGDGQQNLSRASSITSLGSGSESEEEEEEEGQGEQRGERYSADDDDEDSNETYVIKEHSYFPPMATKRGFQARSPDTETSSKETIIGRNQTAITSASAKSSAVRLPSSRSSSSRAITGPPRLSDLFDTTTTNNPWPQARTSTGPYADAIIDNPAADSSPLGPARKRQRRRYCPEPNCCGNALSHPGKQTSSASASNEEAGGAGGEARIKKLFWKRQLWLMEHRGADGLSRCGSEERETSEHEGEDSQHSVGVGATSHDQVLRTAGAGLPLARVKRVMKSADEEIKVSRIHFQLSQLLFQFLTPFPSPATTIDDLTRSTLTTLTSVYGPHCRSVRQSRSICIDAWTSNYFT